MECVGCSGILMFGAVAFLEDTIVCSTITGTMFGFVVLLEE
jgi:hypothetical protein